MTVPVPVPVFKKGYLDMIPDFFGERELLPRFLEIMGRLVHNFYNATNPNDFSKLISNE